ncbi:MAG: hypothetical protein U5K56_19215 [Halioglobus sp.]|nr:hypothetical protein [Halioglobus sp.]
MIDTLEDKLPLQFIKLHHDPNSNSDGVPNPLLEEYARQRVDTIRRSGAEPRRGLGTATSIAVVVRRTGRFIEAITSSACWRRRFSRRNRAPASSMIRDWYRARRRSSRRITAWLSCKSGHAFIEEEMHAEDAIYGGDVRPIAVRDSSLATAA